MPSSWTQGCDGRSSISGNGGYREQACDEVLALATCAWRGLEFHTLGSPSRPIFVPELPAGHHVAQRRRTWTGRTIEYRWRGGGIDVEARTSLPGPLLRARGRTLRLRWCSGAEPGAIEDLVDASRFDAHGLDDARGHRLWLAGSPIAPVVIAASAPVRRIRVTSHMHWEVEFARAGGALLIVPLLRVGDAPRDERRRALWLELAARPPLDAAESFRFVDGDLEIESRFAGARLAPLPTAIALLGASGGLVGSPAGTELLAAWSGPYRVVEGSSWRAKMRMGWSRARWQAARIAGGELAPIPEELAYAGDATWEPGTAMDQLLALRTWAPLLAAAPEPLRSHLVAQLTPPTPRALRDAIEIIREPASKRAYARWRSMWAHVGDACYDIDWYNGLAASGLARATECAAPEIVAAARRTAAKCRRERASLMAYFAIFQDWSLCGAWIDPRGWAWNADCAHNGLEGLLGEARLREAEGDARGAERMRYLAGRTAIGLLSAHELPRWALALRERLPTRHAHSIRIHGMTTWSGGPSGTEVTADDAFGVQAFTSWRDLCVATADTRNPYPLAGNFPEWNALLAEHGDRAAFERLRQAWDARPEASLDWITFYIGSDWRERRARGDQEARVQAAVFYHLAPVVAFRRFVLCEAPEAIERRYGGREPLNLAEQLLLRGGFALADAPARAAKGRA